MRHFNTRVVLYDATIADYLALYTEMAKRNFTDQIVGDDGKVWTLPPGEYTSYGDLTHLQVRDLASAAAAATGVRFAVRVSEAVVTSWAGLEPGKAKAA
ncbi:MAG: hypothetical protein ACK4G5_00810 [Devosia sp.]